MTRLAIFEAPSPNFDDRRADAEIRYLILHYTGMVSAAAALSRMCDARAKVSAHYMFEEDGRILRLVHEHNRAWHAGVSCWEGETDINSFSIGIELVNPGHAYPGYKGGYRPFPEAQMDSLVALCRRICETYNIRPWHVLAHSDVAPGRKKDPGELFDWPRLAREGLAVWPQRGGEDMQGKTFSKGQTGAEITQLQEDLRRYGYGLDCSGVYDAETIAVMSAFQRHFRPARFDGVADPESRTLLRQLLSLKS